MAKYGVTNSPPTFALLDPVYVQQGVLADTFWGTGPITLDTASWEGAGRPRANAIYNSRGQYVLNYPVLRVLAVGPGLLGWQPGDFAAMTYTAIPTFASASPNPDLKGFFNLDPATFPTQPPLLGHPRVAWVVALKVVPVDDAGNPLPTGGSNPPPTPPPTGNPNSGTPLPPIITGNGGSSGGSYQPPTGYPTGYPYPQGAPPVIVSAPPPTIDPNLLTVIAQQGAQQSQLQAQREAREAQYDFQYAQLQARQDEQDRDERAQRRAERQAELEYRRQLRQLDLQRRQQQLSSRAYTDVPRGYNRNADDDLT